MALKHIDRNYKKNYKLRTDQQKLGWINVNLKSNLSLEVDAFKLIT